MVFTRALAYSAQFGLEVDGNASLAERNEQVMESTVSDIQPEFVPAISAAELAQ